VDPALNSETDGSEANQEATMRAVIGDRIIVRSHQIGVPDRGAHVLAVEGPDGGPPYRVRWDDDEHESLFVPGPGALVEHHPAVRPPD
jgi:hypothetical protein